MATKVVDASALAALLFNEPEAEHIASLLANSNLAAPALLGFELANVCVVKTRRHPAQREAIIAAFHLRDRLNVVFHEVDQTGIVELACSTGLTAYDASYLWLARRLGAELVTLDKDLAAAWTGGKS